MDYVYESTSDKLADSQETLQPSTSGQAVNAPLDDKTAEINRKTEESFEKLENEITKTYGVIESRASTLGSSFSSWLNTNFQVSDVINEAKKQVENLHLDQKFNETKTAVTKNIDTIQKKVINDENAAKTKNVLSLVSEKTNTYLDGLDKDLEQVENAAGDFASRFGQFLKSTVSVTAPEQDEDELIDDDVANLLFNVKDQSGGAKVSASRTETQLQILHTSPQLFLAKDEDSKFNKFESSFSEEQKTDEITELLKSTPALQKLSTELVPAKITYHDFWARYFYLKDKILQQELTRKKLLGHAQQSTPITSEDLSWGDDDEEENKTADKASGKNSTSSDGTYELNSVDSSILEVKTNKETSKSTTEDAEEEDDDDDWE